MIKKKPQNTRFTLFYPSFTKPLLCNDFVAGMESTQWWNSNHTQEILTEIKPCLSPALFQPLFSSAFNFPMPCVNPSSSLPIVSFTLPTTQVSQYLQRFSLPTVPEIWSKKLIPWTKNSIWSDPFIPPLLKSIPITPEPLNFSQKFCIFSS